LNLESIIKVIESVLEINILQINMINELSWMKGWMAGEISIQNYQMS